MLLVKTEPFADQPHKPKVQYFMAGLEGNPKGNRLISLDALRGLLMILMAIDHANFFIARAHPTGEFWGISLPHYKSALEFLTRFVTHPCATGFFFLMGVSMILFADSRRKLGWTEGRITRHFIYRGFLLIFLQFNLENPAWLLGPALTLEPPGGGEAVWLHFGVLYGLGATMVIGALLLRFRSGLLITISISTVFVTQLLIPDPSKSDYLYSPLFRAILLPGQTGIVQVFYPVLPWLGLVVFGLVFGKWILKGVSQAYRRALILGIIFLLLFLVVRIIGDFGNIHPSRGDSLISFLNVTKYPPSIAFILMTLSLNMLFLVIFSGNAVGFKRWGKLFLVFGRSALFFYVIHLYLYAFMGLFFASKQGTGVLLMYPFWLVGLVLLYPLCRWYGNFKKRKSVDSIWRFF